MEDTKLAVADSGFVAVNQEDKAAAVQAAEVQRAVAEVQAQVIMAKKFPRDQHEAVQRIDVACRRTSLAEKAVYSYPRGGAVVTGPSIRLAEVLAQNWGNMDFGVREISQSLEAGTSEMEAYAWDLETNVRVTKTFHVPHMRFTRSGRKPLYDPRDIYETAANQGARRLRACILGVIPADVTEWALKTCRETAKGGGGEPMEDRIRRMVTAFGEVGVPKEAIEERLDHNIADTTTDELVDLIAIYRTLKDGQAKRHQYFDLKAHAIQGKEAAKLNARFAGEPQEAWDDAPFTGPKAKEKAEEASAKSQ